MKRLLPLLAALSLPVLAAAPAAERSLAGGKAEKTEVRHSMLGARDTLLFYSFADQQAVLVLRIDNSSERFPVSGTVYLFDPATPREGLERWINNQHSDGLFPEVPTPLLTRKLPETACRITERKLVGETRQGPEQVLFRDYQVRVAVEALKVEGKVRLSALTDDANVYLKADGK